MSSSSESEGHRKIKARSHKRQEEEASEGSEAEAEPDGDTVAVSKKRRVANEVVDPETAAAAQAAGLNIEDFIDPEHDAKRSYNRASAAKSRAKKQKHLEELEAGVEEEEKIHAKLSEKNRELRKDIEEIILQLMQAILAGVVIPDDTLRLLLANEDDEQDNVILIYLISRSGIQLASQASELGYIRQPKYKSLSSKYRPDQTKARMTWVDPKTIDFVGDGAPSPTSNAKKQVLQTQSEAAALLDAQTEVVRFMLGSKVSRYKSEAEAKIPGGLTVVDTKFDKDNNCEIRLRLKL